MTRQMFPKSGCGQGHVTPEIFWALNANSYKTAKGANFKLGRYVPDMTLTNVFEKLAWLGSRDFATFWALSANGLRIL